MSDLNEEIPFEYFALSGADRLKTVKDQLEGREKGYFELALMEAALDGNPESPEAHHESKEGEPPIRCPCRDCELKRIRSLMGSLRYGIQKLKAIHASLS